MKIFFFILLLLSSFSFAKGPSKVCSAICQLDSKLAAVIASSRPYFGFYYPHHCFSLQLDVVDRCVSFNGQPKGQAFSCYATSTVNTGEVCELQPGDYTLSCEVTFESDADGLNSRCKQMHGVLDIKSITCDSIYAGEGQYFDQCL